MSSTAGLDGTYFYNYEGQILKNRQGIRDPALLVVPDDIPVAEDIVNWIDERLVVTPILVCVLCPASDPASKIG